MDLTNQELRVLSERVCCQPPDLARAIVAKIGVGRPSAYYHGTAAAMVAAAEVMLLRERGADPAVASELHTARDAVMMIAAVAAWLWQNAVLAELGAGETAGSREEVH